MTEETTRAKGFETLDEEVRVERLPLRGELPAWLEGRLVRVTPAMLDVDGVALRHWFDGLAMLNAFTIGGGEVSYASRFLDTDVLARAREGEIGFDGFAQDPCRSLFKRMTATFTGGIRNDNANVNLIGLGDRYIAMTEVPLPVEFDPGSLETLGAPEWADRLGGQISTAHPHFDLERDEMINYVAHLAGRSSYRIYAAPEPGASRRLIAKLPVSKPSYMHSFAITERYAILVEFPLRVDPLRLAFSGKPFIDNYRWAPEEGTRFLVVDRTSGELRGTYEGPGMFAFHHVNAFERDGEIVIDLVVHEDGPAAIEALELERLRSGEPPVRSTFLSRCRLPLGGGEVSCERLSDTALELPRTNYGARNTRDYRYVWAAGIGDGSDWFDRIVKIDVGGGTDRAWVEDGCYPSEPVFVPEPGASAEDQGAILSAVLDSRTGRSFLLVLDAATLEELARAEAPHHIPFGFHGDFFPAG